MKNHAKKIVCTSMYSGQHLNLPMCQNFTKELELYHVVINLKIVKINLTVRGRLLPTVQKSFDLFQFFNPDGTILCVS